MVYVRRRYYFWLLKAYVKRWRKTILTSIVLGALAFFAIFLVLNYYVFSMFKSNVEKIGYSGSFTIATLPEEVLSYVSYGLTSVDKDGTIKSAASKKWEIGEEGKVFTFTLPDDLKFNNGRAFEAKDVPYSFKDVNKEVLSKNTIRFTLKTPYAPFLSAVDRPILLKNFGLGEYSISNREENAGFLKSLTLSSKRTGKKKIISFYPTQDALKTAFLLGEVDTIKSVAPEIKPDTYFKGWNGVKVTRNVDYKTLVSLFFNTIDNQLANKKVRQALSYALPASFFEGERSYSFLPPESIYYARSPNEGLLDIELSKQLLESADVKKLDLTITTLDELLPVAEQVAKSWKKIGINTKIVTSGSIPPNYQVLLYPITLPKDPDMYAIWHSNQADNITHYSNVRIDKLLEEGRQTMDTSERIQIYADMQKYLLDDAPAAFLYFPYTYTVTRTN